MGVAPWHWADEGVKYIHLAGNGRTAGGNQGIKYSIAEIELRGRINLGDNYAHHSQSFACRPVGCR